MSTYKKAVAYWLLTCALMALGWCTQAGLVPLSAAGVVGGIGRLLYVGAMLAGFGVYRRRGADARFFMAVGGGVLLLWAVLLVLYGGMEDAAATGADTAANLLMLVWTALPLITLLRGTALTAATRREDTPARRRPLVLATVAVWLWMAILIVTGQMLGFVHL